MADTVDFAWRPDWQALFSNGTVNKPSNNYWTGIVYGNEFASVRGTRVVLMYTTADYYFLQSGNKLLEMGLAGCT